MFAPGCLAWYQPCALKVQVHPSGEVAVVDGKANLVDYLEPNAGSVFKVGWGTDSEQRSRYPQLAGGCAPGCQPMPGSGSCLCSAEVADTPFVLDARGGVLPTTAALRAALHVGSPDPATLVGYTICTTRLCTSRSGVRVHTRGGTAAPMRLTTDTVFEFTDAGATDRPSIRKPARYLRNHVSTVHVGTNQEYVLQDPTPVRIVSCSASSEYPDSSIDTAEPSVDPSGGTKCNEDLWPDKDNGLICSDCKVLVTNMRSKYGGTCDSYCKSFGSVCTGSWEDSDDTCADPSETGTCATNWGETSDAICACADDGNLKKRKGKYACESAYDKSFSTAHFSNGPDARGSWTKLNFKVSGGGGADQSSGVTIDRMVYRLGGKEQERPMRVRLEFSGGETESHTLANTDGVVTLKLAAPITTMHVKVGQWCRTRAWLAQRRH